MNVIAENRAGAVSAVLKDRPTVAWPTVALAVLTVGAWFSSVTAGVQGWMPIWAAATCATLAGFWAFTPLHDATHKSVSKIGWLNDLVGWVCAIPLGGPFTAFRTMHLTHHKHTNDPERDPDSWSGAGPTWMLPLRWLTQDFHYDRILARVTREMGMGFAIQIWGTFLVVYGIVAWFAFNGLAWEMLYLVLIPSRLSVAFLAATFNWLPHAPHEVESRTDRFAATSILIDPWLSPLFLWQNYHLVHHLYPAVPFYRYTLIWRLEKERLVEQGAWVRSVIPSWRRGQPNRRDAA